jgi:hypothetical protein
MTDESTNLSLSGFLDRVGLPASARDRVIAIDRELAWELESDHPDTDGCASLALEAADLIANAGPLGFDWSGWDDNPAEVDSLGFDGIEWGEE